MKSNVRSDTIEEIKTGIHVSFDYFKCTFPLIVRKAELEKTEMNRTIKEIAAFFNIDSKEIGDSYYVPRYKEAYTLGEAIDIRLGGPEFGNGFESCYIELKGQGCKEYEVRCPEKTWDDLLIYFVLRLEGRIKRIDIAIDDYEEKEITFDDLLSKLENNHFTSQFKDRNFNLIGNKVKGRSITFGSHKSSLMFCIYEKLKEQLSKGISCNQEHWIRYEMRFKDQRGEDFAINYLKLEEKDIRTYIMQVFYQMLDIKEDNTRTIDHQCHIPTDLKWQSFLGHVEKYKMERTIKLEGSYLTYEQWFTPIIGQAFLYLITTNHNELYTAITRVCEAAVEQAATYTKQKLKKINSYLKCLNQPLLDLNDIETIKQELKKLIEERKLPF